MAIFKKYYKTASGQEINFDEKFGGLLSWLSNDSFSTLTTIGPLG